MSDEERDQKAEMDAEAVRARRELEPNLERWSARELAEWWSRWYLKAGHKRLGRVLIELAKNKKAVGQAE